MTRMRRQNLVLHASRIPRLRAPNRTEALAEERLIPPYRHVGLTPNTVQKGVGVRLLKTLFGLVAEHIGAAPFIFAKASQEAHHSVRTA